MQQQVYRLSYWRVATEEINYRRFFDINGLAAIRMEDPAVFDLTHSLLFRLIGEKKVTGVRLDHVDGLYDPLAYLCQLQQGCFRALAGAAAQMVPPPYRPFYAVCEKILMKGEQLPQEWPVFGNTGYDFANQVNGVLVDTENAKSFDRIYSRFTGLDTEFAELVYQKKRLVLQLSLSAEINTLGHRLNTISEQDRLTRDFTLYSLTRAMLEVVAFFPVYRSYLNSASVREKVVQYVEFAVARAKRRNPAMNASIFDFLRDVLLLRFPEQAGESDKTAWLDFAMRFQQITGPVMAKGLEDTAFYIYNRLVSLNDVGGTPGRFGTPLELFHGQNLARLKSFPHSMIATATHDSKRGEDLRARIDTLSEIPLRWQKSLLEWSRLNKKKGSLLDGQMVPDRNGEYLLYQTLIGAWPFVEMNPAGFECFRTRIREYLTKAVREAKVNTSWNSPNAAYEAALSDFVTAILTEGPGNAFLEDFLAFQRQIAHLGIFNSLSQTLLKMTSPGVPDFYQGTELWDLTLVDPDNRGPVDFQVRSEALAQLKIREAQVGPGELFRELLAKREDGRIKLYLIFRVLNYRRENRDLFDHGEYLPLEAQGARARNLCAFERRVKGKSVIVVVPRFPASLAPEIGLAPAGDRAWLDTSLKLPEGAAGNYRNVITEERLSSLEQPGGPGISLAQIFASAPVALLEKL